MMAVPGRAHVDHGTVHPSSRREREAAHGTSAMEEAWGPRAFRGAQSLMPCRGPSLTVDPVGRTPSCVDRTRSRGPV